LGLATPYTKGKEKHGGVFGKGKGDRGEGVRWEKKL